MKNSSYTITHPSSSNGFAVVNVAYPADDAGRLTVSVLDAFGDSRTCIEGSATGYGYDKLTAALRGLSVDGVEFTDHCHTDATSARLLKRAQAGESADKILTGKNRAYGFSNWGTSGPTSCYRKAGLDVLSALGYRIIRGV